MYSAFSRICAYIRADAECTCLKHISRLKITLNIND